MNADPIKVSKAIPGRLVIALLAGLAAPASLLTGPYAVLLAPVLSVAALALFVIALRQGVGEHWLLTLTCALLLLVDAVILLGIWQMLHD